MQRAKMNNMKVKLWYTRIKSMDKMAYVVLSIIIIQLIKTCYSKGFCIERCIFAYVISLV